jgi:hypothetical protein
VSVSAPVVAPVPVQVLALVRSRRHHRRRRQTAEQLWARFD